MENKNTIKDFFPVWDKLTDEEKSILNNTAIKQSYQDKKCIKFGDNECTGVVFAIKGRLRVYMLSEEGRELTLFYIEKGDWCVFSASCLLEEIHFEVFIDVEPNTETITVPAHIVNRLNQNNIFLENVMYKKLAERFSDVMWSMQQILFKRIDQRVAAWLVEQNTDEIKVTHSEIAQNLNTAREVISRMLKYFADEKMIALSRGKIIITDRDRLTDISQ